MSPEASLAEGPGGRFRALADAAPALMRTADRDGACTFFNRAWLEFTGRSMRQELGDGWVDGVHPDDRDRCLSVYRRAVAEAAPFEMEYRLRHRSGAHRWLLDRGSPTTAEAEVTGFVGVCVDIHDRRLDRERQALLAEVSAALDGEVGSEERLDALARLLAHRMGDACVVEMLDEEGRHRLVASAARDPDLERLVRAMRRRGALPAHDERGMAGVARTGRPVLIPEMTPELLDEYADAAGADPELESALRARPPRSVVIVPLRARDRSIGVLALTTHGDARLGEGDLELLQEVGARAGLALANARLLAETRLNARRLRQLQEATAALSSAVSVEGVAIVLLAQVRGLLGAEAATAYQVAGDELVALARDGARGELGRWRRVPLDVPAPVTDAVRARQPVWIAGRAEWRERYPQLLAEATARGVDRAAAALPLTAGGVVGVIAVTFPGERRFVAADRDTARVLAEAGGQALARARLQGAAERERERARLLAEVSLALDSGSGVDERLARLAGLLVPRVADLLTVRLADGRDGGSRLARVAHADPGKAALAEELYGRCTAPPERPGPARVMVTGEPEVVADADEEMRRARAPDDALAEGLRRLAVISYMSLPLRARGAVFGALTLMTTAESGRRFEEADLAPALELARRAALAIDNARRYEGEQEARASAERARRRTERLQRVTAALAAAITEEEVARAVAAEAMDALSATACAVVVRDGDGARVLIASGYPDDLLAPGSELPLDSPFPLAAVLRGGEELWFERRSDWTRRFAPPSPGLGAAGVCVPLRMGGETVGAIAFRFGEDERRFAESDRNVVRAMAGQCAQALERARLYESERRAAETLQRALLPAELPPSRAARVEVRYLPAAGGRSGGDFYDALTLPDGRLSVVVGDVVGHGTEAAAIMGQLRSAWRAFALAGAGPATVVRRLSHFAERVDGARVATVACAVVGEGSLRYACAGHPPPLLRRPGEPPAYLMDGRGPPLAVRGPGHDEGREEVPPGSLLLLYTDGVVERRRDLELGLADLGALVAEAGHDPRAVLERIAAEIGPRPADDCALMALATSAMSAPLRVTIPAAPEALAGARARARDWLADEGVDPDQADEVILAVSEALANGVEHAYGGGRDGEVELRIERARDDALAVEVRDRGRWRPPPEDRGLRGRGLPLMHAVMDSVRVERGDGGTTVRMRYRLGPARDRPRRTPPATDPGAAALSTSALPDGTLARLRAEVDAASAPRVGAWLRELRGERVVVDLGGVPHLGSAGVRMLVEVALDLDRDGRRLEVVAPPDGVVRRTLDVAGVTGAPLTLRERPPSAPPGLSP